MLLLARPIRGDPLFRKLPDALTSWPPGPRRALRRYEQRGRGTFALQRPDERDEIRLLARAQVERYELAHSGEACAVAAAREERDDVVERAHLARVHEA